ncbi:hypothetical protein BGX26_004283 [Mortierella sp. AD094]|nr:hypothetical protein BGX26_004283 [Mortierella sp. AD094]
MSPTTELIRIWTEALVPVCNQSRSHASQEVKWLLQHARRQARIVDGNTRTESRSVNSSGIDMRRVSRAGGLSDVEASLMQDYVDQRVKARKPLQYILGTQPFMDLEILTRPPTLIPRWETEEWTARLASVLKSEPKLFPQQRQQHQRINHSLAFTSSTSTTTTIEPSSSCAASSPSQQFNILDICTGSGCIPLGLASALPSRSCNIFGIDIHPKAIQLSKENEVKNRSLLNGNRVQFHQADLLSPDAVNVFLSWLQVRELQPPSDGTVSSGSRSIKVESCRGSQEVAGYNLIISNPPYIAHSEFEALEPEVAQWEDPKALLADLEGLMFYPRIANMAMELLHHNRRTWDTSSASPSSKSSDNYFGLGRQWRNGPDLNRVKVPELVFEIGGDHQVDSVTSAVREAGFSRVEVWRDLADRARCIVGAR